MKYIIGFVLGALLSVGGYAYAESEKTMSVVDWIDYSTFGRMTKLYDTADGVVCYANKNGYSGGISCLKL